MFQRRRSATAFSFITKTQPPFVKRPQVKISNYKQKLRYHFEYGTERELQGFVNDLLEKYDQKKLSAPDLRTLFESSAYQTGLTGLQWFLSQKRPKMVRVIFGFLTSLEQRGLVTPELTLKWVTEMNPFGRNAYFYALRNRDRHTFMFAAAVVYHAFKEGRISAAKFHQLLAQADSKGQPLLAFALRDCPIAVLRFYFYQWENSLEGDKKGYQRFAEALTAPYKLTKINRESYYRTPFMEVLESNEPEKLALYLKQLRSCFVNGAITKESYFRVLTPLNARGQNVLQALEHSVLLACYLQELQQCAEEGLVSYQELIELFKPLALNPELAMLKPESLTFATQELAFSFAQTLRAAQSEQLVSRLPGLWTFKRKLALTREVKFESYFQQPQPSVANARPHFYSFFEQQQLLGDKAEVQVYQSKFDFQPK